jgi:hypothetical protein
MQTSATASCLAIALVLGCGRASVHGQRNTQDAPLATTAPMKCRYGEGQTSSNVVDMRNSDQLRANVGQTVTVRGYLIIWFELDSIVEPTERKAFLGFVHPSHDAEFEACQGELVLATGVLKHSKHQRGSGLYLSLLTVRSLY